VTAGTLTLNGLGQLLNTSGVTLNPSTNAVTVGTMNIDNTGTNLTGRLMSGASPANLVLNNAILNFLGNNTSGVLTPETLGTVTVNSGASFISSQSGSGLGASVTLTIGTLARNTGATVGFMASLNTGAVTAQLNSPNDQILINNLGSGATLINGIL